MGLRLKQHLHLLAVGLLPFIFMGVMRYFEVLEFAEFKTLDVRCRLWPQNIRPSSEITLITVDGKSKAALGTLPWKQGVYFTLLDVLETARPSAVLLIIWFNREEEQSKAVASENLFVIRPYHTPNDWRQHAIPEVTTWGSLPRSLASARAHSFSSTPFSKTDGIRRHSQLVVIDKNTGRYHYALELLALCHYLGVDASQIRIVNKFWRGKYLELPKTKDNERKWRVPIDDRGRMLIRAAPIANHQSPFNHISFVDALNLFASTSGDTFSNEVSPTDLSSHLTFKQYFHNKLVLIGITADEAPRAPTPYGQLTALSMRANALNTILTQQFIRRLSRPVDIIYLSLLYIVAVIATILLYRANKSYLWILLIGFMILVVHTIIVLFAFRFRGIWLDFTRPSLAIITSSLVASLYSGYLRLQSLVRELQTTQQQLVQSEKEAVYGRMTAQVRHEIKGILNVIRSPAEVIRTNFHNDDPLNMTEHPEKLIHEMDFIIQNVTKLNDMVENELSFFQNTSFYFDAHDVTQIIHAALIAVEADIQERRIVTSVDIDPNLPKLLADADKLQIAFANLIKNACQAMPSGGALRIEGEYRSGIPNKKKSDSKVVQGIAVIKFHDTGSGISPEDKEKIFEPFYTNKPRGLGLGLSIVQNIITGHNGEITVDSHPGKGTTFTVTLPINCKG